VRVDGVYTPEITGDYKEEGFRVKGIVEKFLRGAEAITIAFTGKVSFNRWVCIVCVDDKNLSTWIEENKLTKDDLCPDE
jgi:endonuclease YncB( thermonuclease family)